MSQHLKKVWQLCPPDSYIVVCSARNNRWEQTPFKIEDIDLALKHLEIQPPDAQLFLRITPVRRDPGAGKRGTAQDAAGSQWLWLDIDFHGIGENGDTRQRSVDGVMEGIRTSSLPATFYVKSGRGLHCYWQLDHFETNLVALQSALRGLAHKFKDYGADPAAADLARVLRVAGSWHMIAQVEAELVLTPENRIYQLSEFPTASTSTPGTSLDGVEIVEELIPPNFVEEVGRRNPSLMSRILTEEGVPAKPYSEVRRADGTIDRSRNDYYIIRELLRLGYSPGVVLSVMHHSEWFSGERFREGRHAVAEYAIRSAVADSLLSETSGFFVGRKFQPERVSAHLQSTTPIISIDRDLYLYSEGVYKRDTGNSIRHRIWRVLSEANCWSSHHENEVYSNLQSMDDTPIETLNNYPDLINLRNGILNIRTKELMPHSPSLFFTVQLPVEYDPEADPTTVDQFLTSIVPEDVIPVIWEFSGFCFTPGYDHKAILFLVGPAHSGKTTLLEFLRRMLGVHNTSAMPLEALANSHFALGDLFGKLANIESEVSAHVDLIGTEKIKRLASPGQFLSADVKYRKNPLKFESRAKLMFGANKYPTISRVDNAVVERFLCIPCEKRFLTANSVERMRYREQEMGVEPSQGDTAGDADIFMLDKLTSPHNLSAALNRSLEGLERLRNQGGFSQSDTVVRENLRFEVDVDHISRFVQEMSHRVDDIERGDKSTDIKPKMVWGVFQRWLEEEGIRSRPTKSEFLKQIVARKYVTVVKGADGSASWRGRCWNTKLESNILEFAKKVANG